MTTSQNTSYDFDLIVIGAGSGGVRASRLAASLGKKVLVIEKSDLGGTCVNLGCVPKKLMSYAAHFKDHFEDAETGYGWTFPENPQFSWSKLIERKNIEISRLNAIYERILKQSGAQLVRGHGEICGEHEVKVGEKVYSTQYILICTGSSAYKPPLTGIENTISSDDFFHLENAPKRATVYGGGYIGVELASILHGLGVKTQLLYRGPLFLKGFDADIRSFLAEEMRKKGVEIHFETEIDCLEKTDNGVRVILNNHDEYETDIVLMATGRKANTKNLGLQNVGVTCCQTRGCIEVNPEYQTNIPSIYAIGDVIDQINLTPVALAQGMAVVKTLFENQKTTVNLDNIATAIFSNPNAATVGLTEEQARQQFGQVDIYKSQFTPMRQSLSNSSEKALMKLVVDQKSQRVLGCHMVGADAGEIIQGLAIAVKMGATKADFDATIGIHPTMAEEFVTMRTKERDPTPFKD